jgi:NAD+ dependent glucose-6-phosphate dehydrogenase
MNALADSYAVHGLDLRRGHGVDWVGDMARRHEVQGAFDGMSAVIHLAADARLSASWDSVVRNNVTGTVNALDAAREAGVRRVVFASSNHVVGRYEQDEPYASIVAGDYAGVKPAGLPRIGADAVIRPDGPYGSSKAFGEAAGRYYADVHGLSVICLRIGTVNALDRPENPRHFATLLTHRDLVHLVHCSLGVPNLPFGVYYGVSANTWRFWDVDHARREIGYQPRDNAERWR